MSYVVNKLIENGLQVNRLFKFSSRIERRSENERCKLKEIIKLDKLSSDEARKM